MKNASELYGPTLFLFYIVMAVAGNETAMLYLFLVKGAYAVIVSVVIHDWGKKRDILIEDEKNAWTVMINGIPVNETRSSLKNLHFRSEAEMIKSYRFLILPKIVLLTVLSVLSIQITYAEWLLSGPSLSFIVGVLVNLFLLMKNIEAIKLFNKVEKKQCKINLYELGEGFYYSAFIAKPNNQYVSLLNEVFK